MSLKGWVILQTIVGLLAVLPAFGLQLIMGMGGATPGAGTLGQLIASLGYLFPFVLIGSLIGMWLTYLLKWRYVTILCLVMPWMSLVILLSSIALLLSSNSV